jgi:FMN phosphatase YigB (HAD superfamily)
MITHISFDVWKTLFWPNKTFSETRSDHVADLLGMDRAVVRKVYKTTKDGFDKIAEAEGTGWDSATVYRTLLANLGRLDHPWEEICFETERLFLQHPPTILGSTIDTISELRGRGYTLSIASNTNFASGRVLANVLENVLGPWDFMVFSDLLGTHSKPAPEFFAAVITKAGEFNIAPENILHVGDNAVCDGAAAQHGMATHIISGPEALPTVFDVLPAEKVFA